jgi:HAD superfamily hydrolase (TIGR01509 family)
VFAITSQGETVTAVIFDVGGVLIDWNPRYLYRRMFNGDHGAMERFLTEVCSPAWNLRQDAGRPFAEAVAELACRYPEHAGFIAAYDEAWEEMVAGAHDETIAIVRQLKARATPLYCLTNFSREKFPLMRQRFDVFGLFDGIVVSGEIGLVKPDPAIYRHLLERFHLQAAECFFIDDVEANVEIARASGMRAVLYRSSDELRRVLVNEGVM